MAARCTGEQPVLLIVQDRSNSMWADPSPATCGANCTSKWAIAQSVVPDVVNQFSGDFRYGLMVYPGDRVSASCATGVTSLAVGSTPAQIAGAYNSSTNSPAGATPTADTLWAARDSLAALNAQAPAHVLLITDGVPNCNLALDPNSCRSGPTCTGGTASCTAATTGKYCLDDARTEQAAADLFAAGHKVFVVGFGADVSADHNAAVLNGVAAAGGTTMAYSASTQAALESVLQQIIATARDCCVDACNPSADPTCAPSGGSRNICQLGGEGCYVWNNEACNTGNSCVLGTCAACNTTCAVGATQCGAGGELQTCVADAQGCTRWNNGTCAPGTTCANGTCQSCTTTCTAGASECVGNGTRTCVADANGCTSWGSVTSCPSGMLCGAASGMCESCTATCVAGSRMCTDAFNARECVADASGCTSWMWQACPGGTMCGGGTCGACNSCTAGQTRCSGNGVQTCTTDGQGCTAWQDTSTCVAPQFCNNGACDSCPAGCTPGARECNGNDIRECAAGANGCPGWSTINTCAAPQVCMGGACCTNACTAGAVRCASNGTAERCDVLPTGCSGWVRSDTCVEGESCVDGDCLVECNFNGESDDCPVGFECQPDTTPAGAHCYPRPTPDAGPGGTSSSSGGASTSGGVITRGDGGARGGAGAGAEDDEPVNNCGCESAAPGELPAGVVLMGLAGLWLVRRRR